MNPATFLRVLGPEPWNVAYVEPSIRPDDGRYGENPNRLQQHYQFQVILKPDPGNPQEIYLQSLEALGIDPAPARHPLRRGQLGIAGAGRLGTGLGGLAGRAGDHPVHLLPAGRRHAARPGVGGDHLRPGAHPHRPAGGRHLPRDPLERDASPTATCTCRASSSTARYNFEIGRRRAAAPDV